SKPENYGEELVGNITDDVQVAAADFKDGIQPNVIVIMSESYADFRVFDQLNVDDKYYEGFDKARSEGYAGTAITPTYASYTVRSEFELLFGLPVRGLNAPNMPQRVLAEREQPALAQYYKSWGYKTAYVHPFLSTFYSRSRIYGNFGFDQLIFHDDIDNVTDFTVPVEHYGTYVDDKTVYDQLYELVKTTDEPMYIHTTTMQNHQPYNQGDDPDDEFGNYLQWIQHSNEGLTVFLDELKQLDEPTLVFFVGDHFPSLRGETSVYNQLDLNGSNCGILYEQEYFIWSNYDADYSCVPEKPVSFFYMPYVLIDIIGAPHDEFIEKMNGFMETVPVYSVDYNDGTPDNEELDVLTYDRVIGDVYSPCPIPSEAFESHKGEE
ncbi:MAG: LTA synthase family protein, partial [Ruminococcus sp.]|nr:LTA synthase family protein [Ruminococcus sp.]